MSMNKKLILWFIFWNFAALFILILKVDAINIIEEENRCLFASCYSILRAENYTVPELLKLKNKDNLLVKIGNIGNWNIEILSSNRVKISGTIYDKSNYWGIKDVWNTTWWNKTNIIQEMENGNNRTSTGSWNLGAFFGYASNGSLVVTSSTVNPRQLSYQLCFNVGNFTGSPNNNISTWIRYIHCGVYTQRLNFSFNLNNNTILNSTLINTTIMENNQYSNDSSDCSGGLGNWQYVRKNALVVFNLASGINCYRLNFTLEDALHTEIDIFNITLYQQLYSPSPIEWSNGMSSIPVITCPPSIAYFNITLSGGISYAFIEIDNKNYTMFNLTPSIYSYNLTMRSIYVVWRVFFNGSENNWNVSSFFNISSTATNTIDYEYSCNGDNSMENETICIDGNVSLSNLIGYKCEWGCSEDILEYKENADVQYLKCRKSEKEYWIYVFAILVAFAVVLIIISKLDFNVRFIVISMMVIILAYLFYDFFDFFSETQKVVVMGGLLGIFGLYLFRGFR